MRKTAMWFVSGILSATVTAPGLAAGPAPGACATISRAEAEKLVGGPLGELYRHETKADSTNGGDHTTYCGYFPKGYNIQKAEAPAERGLMITLHEMRKPADAKNFYEGTAEMAPQMVQQTVGKDAKVTPIAGIGEAGHLKPAGDMPLPYSVANLTFLRGNVIASVQAWKKSGTADEIARAAAKQVAVRLP